MAPGRATSTSVGVSMWQKYKSLLFTTDTVHNCIHPEQHILAAPLFFNPQWFSLWIAVSHDMPQFANTVQGGVRNVATVTCKVSIHEIMSAGLSRECLVLGFCFGLSKTLVISWKHDETTIAEVDKDIFAKSSAIYY